MNENYNMKNHFEGIVQKLQTQLLHEYDFYYVSVQLVLQYLKLQRTYWRFNTGLLQYLKKPGYDESDADKRYRMYAATNTDVKNEYEEDNKEVKVTITIVAMKIKIDWEVTKRIRRSARSIDLPLRGIAANERMRRKKSLVKESNFMVNKSLEMEWHI